MNPTTAVLKNVRLSFVYLVTPKLNDKGEPRYSATLLIPKNSEAAEVVKRITEEAKRAGMARKWGGKFPASAKLVIHDGDGTRPGGEPFGPECKGHYVLTATNRNRPALFDMDGARITADDALYSGCYADVVVNAYAYDHQMNKGITYSVEGVRKVADGERLGGLSVDVSGLLGVNPDDVLTRSAGVVTPPKNELPFEI